MTAELYKLGAIANLSGRLTSGASTLLIQSGVNNWPTDISGQFRTIIDAEVLILQGGSGPTFNILARGAENSVQMAHNDWAAAVPLVTPQAIANVVGGVNNQSGNNLYTFGQVDRAALVSFYASGSISGILLGALNGDTASFGPHWLTTVVNNSQSGLTITPVSGSSINSLPSLTLPSNQGVQIFSDGSGYKAVLIGVGSGSIVSGNVQSGQLSTYHLSSGTIASISQYVSTYASGTNVTNMTQEIISGVRAVHITQSGHIRIAMASVSGRMPAIGVVWDNVLSGIQCNVYTDGVLQFTSGLGLFSGSIGSPVWVGRSGQITLISGLFNPNGFASGDYGQKMGIVSNSGAVCFRVDPTVWSGGPMGSPTAGLL
jgi:hypothetical protein